jgi:hypothetical protein
MLPRFRRLHWTNLCKTPTGQVVLAVGIGLAAAVLDYVWPYLCYRLGLIDSMDPPPALTGEGADMTAGSASNPYYNTAGASRVLGHALVLLRLVNMTLVAPITEAYFFVNFCVAYVGVTCAQLAAPLAPAAAANVSGPVHAGQGGAGDEQALGPCPPGLRSAPHPNLLAAHTPLQPPAAWLLLRAWWRRISHLWAGGAVLRRMEGLPARGAASDRVRCTRPPRASPGAVTHQVIRLCHPSQSVLRASCAQAAHSAAWASSAFSTCASSAFSSVRKQLLLRHKLAQADLPRHLGG